MTTCIVPLVAGSCGQPVPDGSPLPLCFTHTAEAWEYCQGRIARERIDRREAEDAERAETFVEEFRAARQEIAQEYAALVADPEIDDPDSVVYYLRFADRIKIGFSRNLGNRLLAIPHDELLAVEPGGPVVEQRRHRQFAEHRIKGEWFQSCPALLDHIASVKTATAERSRGQAKMAAAFKAIEPEPPWLGNAERLGLRDPMDALLE